MLLRLIGSTLRLGILFLLMLTPKLALADMIYGDNYKSFGVITAISDTQVSISSCDSTTNKVVKWDTIRSIVLTGGCNVVKEDASNRIGWETDCKERLTLFFITFKNGGSSILADSVSMGSDRIIQVTKRDGTFTGPARSVSKIARVKACSDAPLVQKLMQNSMPSDFKPQP